jgi:hypothetical protein
VTAIVTTNATHLTQPVNFVLMKGLLQAARKKLPYFNGTLPGELIKMGGSSAVKWERINNLAAVTTALGEFVGQLGVSLRSCAGHADLFVRHRYCREIRQRDSGDGRGRPFQRQYEVRTASRTRSAPTPGSR